MGQGDVKVNSKPVALIKFYNTLMLGIFMIFARQVIFTKLVIYLLK